MISLVIPTFSATKELEDIALQCAESFRPWVNELIVTEDADVYSKELHDISDVYLLHPKLGYTKNLNLGWKAASGDYVMHVSADCKLLKGNPNDLCKPGVVVSPRVQALESDPPWGRFSGAAFVVPREVSDKVGMFDSATDWQHNPDVEYVGRLQVNGIGIEWMSSVVLEHAALSPGPFYRAEATYNGRQET